MAEKAPTLEVHSRKAPRQGALNGHDLIARNLRQLGVTHIYGISGTPVYETLAACAKVGMRVIGVRHQQAAAMVAAAQNHVCGRIISAVILSAGPAVTNAATGILVAYDNGWRLVVLGGRRPLGMQHLGSFQQLDATAIFRPITKSASLVESAAETFGLTAMEMETAVRLRVPVIVVIANNDGNGGVLVQQKFYAENYPDRVTMFKPDLRYEEIMRTFGGHAEFVEQAAELKPAFARAIASGLPACINVRVDPRAPFPR